MITLPEYLDNLNAKKVILVEIAYGGSFIYIADTSYITEPGDGPANQSYSAVISESGIPRLSRRIQEVWGGRSVASWGPLELATQFVKSLDLSSIQLRGNDVSILLTGPREDVLRSEAVTILSGSVGSRSGNADGGLVLEIEDEQARWNDLEVPVNQYDGTESVSFPAANVGKTKPIALGLCRNVPAILIDLSNNTYQVHDGVMEAIDAVYDNGVSVAFTTDLNAGTFVLTANPAGTITCDVKGVKEAGNYHQDTSSIIDWLVRIYGGLVSQDVDITGLPTQTIGIYLSSATKLSDVITRLMTGVLGWWGFDRQGTFKARLFNAPVAGGATFTETKHLSDVTWSEEDEIIWSVPLLYQRNWLPLEPASSVDLDTASWMRSQGLLSRVNDENILSVYASAQTAPTVETYFDDKAAADAVAVRALALFGTLRRRGKLTLPVSSPMLELGGSITLEDADILNGHHLLVGLIDNLDAAIPKTDVEIWG